MNEIQHKQKGLSLIELLVALALSAAVISGIIQVFISNRVAYNISESSIRAQENGRFALDFVSAGLRSSGDYGCFSDIDNTNQVVTDSDGTEVENNNIQSFITSKDFNNADFIQTDIDIEIGGTFDGDPVAGYFDEPDSLTLFAPTGNRGLVTAITSVAPITMAVDGGEFEEHQFVLVSDCNFGDLIELGNGTDETQIVDDTGNLRTDVYAKENATILVQEVNVIRYWVSTTNNTLNTTSFSYESAGAQVVTQTLIDGIENIQFNYGVDTGSDGVPDYYASYDDVAANRDLDGVVAIKMHVLALAGSGDDSEGGVASQAQTITFAGQTRTAPDLRLRKVFETTVALRNRISTYE